MTIGTILDGIGLFMGKPSTTEKPSWGLTVCAGWFGSSPPQLEVIGWYSQKNRTDVCKPAPKSEEQHPDDFQQIKKKEGNISTVVDFFTHACMGWCCRISFFRFRKTPCTIRIWVNHAALNMHGIFVNYWPMMPQRRFQTFDNDFIKRWKPKLLSINRSIK